MKFSARIEFFKDQEIEFTFRTKESDSFCETAEELMTAIIVLLKIAGHKVDGAITIK